MEARCRRLLLVRHNCQRGIARCGSGGQPVPPPFVEKELATHTQAAVPPSMLSVVPVM